MDSRLLPHPPAAALRLRRSERDEGRGAGARRGHRRPRHGQSRRRAAARTSSTSLPRSPPSPTPTAIRRAAASPASARPRPAYYQRRFGVTVDPDKEVIVTLGSKEGLANLAQAITAPGDVVLAPNPSYPIHTFGFIIAGAAIRSIPAAPGDDFFAPARNAMRYTVPRPKVLVVGYPSNPTAYVADLAFYERLVAFAREHELIVISDLAYAEIYFGDTPTPSILQVEGAKDVAVEFTSHVQDLFDGRLADRLRGRQRAADRGAGAGEILPRLWRVHAGPGRRGRRAQRPAGHRRGQPHALQEAPRRAGRKLRPRRLGRSRSRRHRCSPGRRSPSASATSARWSSPSSC